MLKHRDPNTHGRLTVATKWSRGSNLSWTCSWRRVLLCFCSWYKQTASWSAELLRVLNRHDSFKQWSLNSFSPFCLYLFSFNLSSGISGDFFHSFSLILVHINIILTKKTTQKAREKCWGMYANPTLSSFLNELDCFSFQSIVFIVLNQSCILCFTKRARFSSNFPLYNPL